MFAISSCTRDENNVDPNTVTSEEGYAKGKVVDVKGNPLQGAKIVVDNTMIYHSNALGTSDNNGVYKIQLPKVGTFMISATIRKVYNGQEFDLPLHPDIYEPFSIAGAVVNFQWKMTGKKPLEENGYYGGTVHINKSLNSTIYDSENIEFTLVPVGKLIDGSEGKTLKLKHGKPYSDDYGYLVDIPIGRYKISGEYSSDGVRFPVKLRDHFSDDRYVNELVFDFEASTIWGDNAAFISYEE
ncbi:hypothetical protein DYBT9275_00502 [Dyadobacter sp. CECT 9275]|uniref:Carboxypeptidase regulatory-like domain-containing protein n=1 Tax=Dyadobacter helix TaxID=2822344 RepID=A0A916NAG2_9BACT|nr:Ig-like domain-containing protein [Dyadobacter sp. CECT 9275]CAG4990316.1 hypothetical protein DYBT9275_00502 [Dyadobacter sp. CECT 9275]